MLVIIKNDIFPIFSVLLLGFCLGKYKIISREEASTLNKIGFLVFQPALIFTLILNTNIAGILFQALGLYALAQIVLFLLTLLICLKFLKLQLLEACDVCRFRQYVDVYLANLTIDVWQRCKPTDQCCGALGCDRCFCVLHYHNRFYCKYARIIFIQNDRKAFDPKSGITIDFFSLLLQDNEF